MRVFTAIVLIIALLGSAKADIILTIGTGNKFVQNTGVHTIDIFAKTSPTAESKPTLSADFRISGGAFAPTSNGFGDAGGGIRTGQIGGTGFLGNSNIELTSFFAFDPADNKFAVMSLEFTSPQPFTVADTLVARLTVDVNGLAVNDYTISITGITSGGVQQGSAGTANGSFSITAVPEPTTLLLIGGTSVCAFVFRSFRRVQKVQR